MPPNLNNELLRLGAQKLGIEAQTIRTMIDSGFEAQSATDAVVSGDFSKLKHTGLFSVQLQAPGSTKMPQGEAPGELPVAGGAAALLLGIV